jgi:ribosomal protein S18 acetylase RimI-like enzyme
MKLGLSHVDLKVERENPHGAIAFYDALGFSAVAEGL